MLIVFEGPDGAGKTRIAYDVQRKLSAIGVRCGPPQKDYAFNHWNQVLDLAEPGRRMNLVCDRLHWGDHVYSAAYRPEIGPQLNASQTRYLDYRIHALGGLMVHVTASTEALVDRFDGDYIDQDDLERIRDSYFECERRYNRRHPDSLLRIETTSGFNSHEYRVNLVVQKATQRWEETHS